VSSPPDMLGKFPTLRLVLVVWCLLCWSQESLWIHVFQRFSRADDPIDQDELCNARKPAAIRLRLLS
jgi:hypothetical protein